MSGRIWGCSDPTSRIVPRLSIWSSQLNRSELERLGDQIVRVCTRQEDAICPSELNIGEVDLTDVAIHAIGHYEFLTPYTLTPYLGGGFSIHLVNASGDLIEDTFVEEALDAITAGIDLVGGLRLPLTPASRCSQRPVTYW